MSHLEALAKVSFDPGVFTQVARQRVRRTFVYLLLLVLIATGSTTMWVMFKLHEGARWLEPHLDEIPTITIKDGKASADVEQPWVKHLGTDEKGHQVVAIIDTTGTLDGFQPNEIGVFLKQTEILVKQEDQERIFPLSRFPDTTVGPDIVRGWIKEAMRRAPFYIGAFLLAWYLFAKTMTAVVLVLAGLVTGRSLRFGQLFTVAVYALTPAVLLGVLEAYVIHVPAFWLVYWALAITYTIIGASRAASVTPPAPPPADTATL